MNEKEICPKCKQEIYCKRYYDEYGDRVKEYSCGHRVKSVVWNDLIHFSERVVVTAGLYFELTEPVPISGLKKDTGKIEFVFDENDPSLLNGFKINVSDLQGKKNIINAYQVALRLTNLISLKTGLFIFHKRPLEIINGEITKRIAGFSIDALLTKLVNFDLTTSEIQTYLSSDSKITQQVAHFVNGQKALNGASFGEAIKEFYQVIEYENLPHLEKYKYLRHGVSHSELTSSETIGKLKDEFGIICVENPNSLLTPKGKYVDVTSPEIQDKLEEEANKLREEVIRFLDNKLKVKTN